MAFEDKSPYNVLHFSIISVLKQNETRENGVSY